MARQFFHIIVLLVLNQMFFRAVTAQQCTGGGSEKSIFGWMLQGHVYKTMFAELPHTCVLWCRRDDRCQSLNWVISLSMCEFSNRTKEARPEDFIPNPDRFYFRRDKNRVPLGSMPELPAKTCTEIKASEGGQAISKKYWFSTIQPGVPVLAYCDMKTEDIDECTAFPSVCDVNANCTNTRGSYGCTCRSGFSGDGKTCKDIDECTAFPSVCDVNANCTNTRGSYGCTCKSGFSGDGKTCKDVDECTAFPSVCDVNANCKNTRGSYGCTCKSGFSGDGKICKDINECSASPSVCDVNANCQNNEGSYLCFCKVDFVGDGKTCTASLITATNSGGCYLSIKNGGRGLIQTNDGEDYGDDKDCQWSLSSNTLMELVFHQFNTELPHDHVSVYDGNSMSSPLIGRFGGSSLPAPITSSSNNLFVRFTSDKSVQRAGFSALYRAITPGSIRLHGSNPSRGRVEIFYNNQWGTICDDGWDLTDANVVCRQLGFPNLASRAFHGAHDGRGSGPIWMDNIACSGSESHIYDCSHNGWGKHDCTHSKDASVQCSYGYTSVRLANGGASNRGRVEVYYNGRWGTVCDDHWDLNDAHVVCRQLGFPSASSAPRNAAYGQGSSTIWMDDVGCQGGEASIFECLRARLGEENCSHGEDASVVCNT